MYNENLTTFVCVADYGSFNKAAEKLYISSTAVIKQINVLEKHLNLQLFYRSNQGIKLTPAGNALYKDAKYLFEFSKQSIAHAREEMNVENTVFRVGSSILNPCKQFMELWNQVNNQFPQYKLQIVPFEDNHDEILSVIEQLGIKFDFIVGVCNSKKWLARCNMLPLGNYKKCISVPSYHRLAHKKKLEITDLYGETLVMVKRGDSITNDLIRDELETKHPAIHIQDAEHFYDINVFNHCEQSGYVLLNLECWKEVHPTLVTIPVNWDYTIPYGLLYALNPSPDVQQLVTILQNNNELKPNGKDSLNRSNHR